MTDVVEVDIVVDSTADFDLILVRQCRFVEMSIWDLYIVRDSAVVCVLDRMMMNTMLQETVDVELSALTGEQRPPTRSISMRLSVSSWLFWR